MSEQRRDEGMTLTELLIAVAIMGLLASVLATSIIVTLRQRDNTEGRLNVSRAEQNVSMWIPADLASANSVIKDPEASPCPPATTCGVTDLSNGSNVLMVTWSEVTDVSIAPDGTRTETAITTNVSYNFYPESDGTYSLRRVECKGSGGSWTCGTNVVLRDLPPPPGGATFYPGVAGGANCTDPDNAHPSYANPTPTNTGDDVPCTVPTWVVVVSFPLRAEATSDADENIDTTAAAKSAKRVIVTIQGGGDSDGAGGGLNRVSITAGGTVRGTIDADAMTGVPTFVQARSRCGGPLTLVVDESTSIRVPTNYSHRVIGAVRKFVETLVGTPTQIQIVEFERQSKVLGAPAGAWHHYFDMTDIAQAQALLDLIGTAPSSVSSSWNGTSAMRIGDEGGDTNWEDALYRTFLNANGTRPVVTPETVIFFTDGVPTSDRMMSVDGTGGDFTANPGTDPTISVDDPWVRPPYPEYQGGRYNQVSFHRAELIAKEFRIEQGAGSIRLLGVGVGGVNDTQTWIDNPGTPWQSKANFEQRTDYQSRVDYEKRRSPTSSQWDNIGPVEYFAGKAGASAASYRINSNNGGTRTWYNLSSYGAITATQYATFSATRPSDYRLVWTASTAGAYFVAKDTSPTFTAADWRINGQGSWRPVSQDIYDRRGESPAGNDNSYWQYSTGLNPTTHSVTGKDLLGALVAGSGAQWGNPTDLTTAESVDGYVLGNTATDWQNLATALETIALGECGGTLTLSTRLGSATGTPAPDPITYQKTGIFGPDGSYDSPTDGGAVLPNDNTTGTTNLVVTTRTFDFPIDGSSYTTVEFEPQLDNSLLNYEYVGWSCRAGIRTNKPVATYPLLDVNGNPTGWHGMRVDIKANEALACTMAVNPRPSSP